MRYTGSITAIEAIDHLLITTPQVALVSESGKSGIYKGMVDEDSTLRIKHYQMRINGHIAGIKLGLEDRNNRGVVLIRDDNAWQVAQLVPDIVPLMAKLKPMYHHKKQRGEFLTAMDILLGVKNE